MGGGQLGRMLVQAGLDWGLECRVLDAAPDGPCAYFKGFVQGSPADENDVLAFGRDLDVLTVEMENVCVSALEKLADQGVNVRPSPEVMAVVQDKARQKQFLEARRFPTAPFVFVNNDEELRLAAQTFGAGVLKLRRGGYDGKGVSFELSGPFLGPSIVEERIDLAKELSVIVARGADGQSRAFDPVETFFRPGAHLVEKLVCPPELSSSVLRQAQNLSLRIAEALNHVGVLAVEFFLDKNEKLWVNEISPRPHNTGHHTIEAAYVSQFEQHLRAILDLPLVPSNIRFPSAMINILGVKNGTPEYRGLREIMAVPGIKVHLYGKKIATPNRKLGHITVIGDDARDVAEKLSVIDEKFSVV